MKAVFLLQSCCNPGPATGCIPEPGPGAALGPNTLETNQIIQSGKQVAAIAGPAAAPLHALALSTATALNAVAWSSGCNYSTSDMEIPMTRCSGEAAPPSSETNGLILETGYSVQGQIA